MALQVLELAIERSTVVSLQQANGIYIKHRSMSAFEDLLRRDSGIKRSLCL